MLLMSKDCQKIAIEDVVEKKDSDKKTFYDRKIVIHGFEEIITIVVSSYVLENLDIKLEKKKKTVLN